MKDISEVPRVYLAGIAVIVVCLIGFIGFKSLSGPSYPVGPTASQAYQTIDGMARSTQGDYTKLSPEQQRQIDDFARGRGKEFLAKRYKIITGEK